MNAVIAASVQAVLPAVFLTYQQTLLSTVAVEAVTVVERAAAPGIPGRSPPTRR